MFACDLRCGFELQVHAEYVLAYRPPTAFMAVSMTSPGSGLPVCLGVATLPELRFATSAIVAWS